MCVHIRGTDQLLTLQNNYMRGCLTIPLNYTTIHKQLQFWLCSQESHADILINLIQNLPPTHLTVNPRQEHTVLFRLTTHLDQSSQNTPDLCLICVSDSRIKQSLYYTRMVIRSIKHLHMSVAWNGLCSTSLLLYNSRWRAHVSSTRCEQRRHKRRGKRIACNARLETMSEGLLKKVWGIRSYLMHWTDCFQVWWACFSLRLQVERTSEMGEYGRTPPIRAKTQECKRFRLSAVIMLKAAQGWNHIITSTLIWTDQLVLLLPIWSSLSPSEQHGTKRVKKASYRTKIQQVT